jgi:uncharacterized membrane protein
MNSKSSLTAAALAAIALASACAHNGKMAGAPSGAKGQCWGVNACKGKGACGGPDGHACAGQNTCKGQGWLNLTKADCDGKHGTFKANL